MTVCVSLLLLIDVVMVVVVVGSGLGMLAAEAGTIYSLNTHPKTTLIFSSAALEWACYLFLFFF